MEENLNLNPFNMLFGVDPLPIKGKLKRDYCSKIVMVLINWSNQQDPEDLKQNGGKLLLAYLQLNNVADENLLALIKKSVIDASSFIGTDKKMDAQAKQDEFIRLNRLTTWISSAIFLSSTSIDPGERQDPSKIHSAGAFSAGPNKVTGRLSKY